MEAAVPRAETNNTNRQMAGGPHCFRKRNKTELEGGQDNSAKERRVGVVGLTNPTSPSGISPVSHAALATEPTEPKAKPHRATERTISIFTVEAGPQLMKSTDVQVSIIPTIDGVQKRTSD